MSVYAPVPAFVDQKRHSRALFLIVAAHAAILAAVMMAKSDIVRPIFRPTTVTLIPEQAPPPENPPAPQPQERQSAIDHPTTVVPIPELTQPTVEPTPPFNPGPLINPNPGTSTNPPVEPVRVGPRFSTPADDVKPPYPQSKLRLGQEAVLRLKLSIDERGRVTAVEPVGAADPVFFSAARRHLIAHWRYRPATEDGRPVATSTTITLRFQLDQ